LNSIIIIIFFFFFFPFSFPYFICVYPPPLHYFILDYHWKIVKVCKSFQIFYLCIVKII
jgi:hypothetical protein